MAKAAKVLGQWPKAGLRGKTPRFAQYFDGQVWKLDQTKFGYEDLQKFRNAVHSAAKARGVALRTTRLSDGVHLVFQAIGEQPTRAQQEALTDDLRVAS